MGLTLGVDIGGTKVLGGVVDEDGRVLAQARRPTPATDVPATLDRIVEVIRELTATYEVEAVGIGAAGWIDAKRSTVLFAPNLAWRNEPLREEVARHVPVPVVVENDANVGTHPINAEHLFLALDGLGKPAALYMYPYEGHGPIARETTLDQWARWVSWLDRYVMNPQKK